MASGERDLRGLSDRELNSLKQKAIAEQVRRVEEDPNAFIISGSASIEEDLKVLDTILAKANPKT